MTSSMLRGEGTQPHTMSLAVALQRFAVPLGVTGALLAGRSALLVARDEPEPVAEQWALAGLALLVVSALAWTLTSLARRTYQRAGRRWFDGAESIHLYLRPFTTDQATAPQPGGSSPPHLEEELASVLSATGVPAAVSNPDEKLGSDFPLGFVRLDVPAHYRPKLHLEPWQQYVIELMDRAQIVTAIAGSSSSMRWEIKTALERHDRSRLAFFVGPEANEDDIAGLRLACSDAGVTLPAEMSNVMAVTFDERGLPFLWQADHEVWSPKVLRHKMRAAVREVLGPAHRSLGRDQPATSLRRETARAVARYAGFTILVGGFGAAAYLIATVLFVPVDLLF